MKVLKPMQLSVLHRVYESAPDMVLTLSVMVFFPLDAPRRTLPEIALWKFLPKALGDNVVFDLCMPKPRGEVLVSGSAFPTMAPQAACRARVSIGRVDKTLLVVGDREWRDGAMTSPCPFTEMPVTWERAFGGAGFADNPVGRGFAPVGCAAMMPGAHKLPNVEDPRSPVRDRNDRPRPAGFGPLDFTWPQRFSKLGTHDQNWLETRFPGLAADLDWSAFNAAPEDQHIDGFWRGDERFVVENLCADQSVIEGDTPGPRDPSLRQPRAARWNGLARRGPHAPRHGAPLPVGHARRDDLPRAPPRARRRRPRRQVRARGQRAHARAAPRGALPRRSSKRAWTVNPGTSRRCERATSCTRGPT